MYNLLGLVVEMKYDEVDNDEFAKVMDELISLIGVSYSSEVNDNHYGTTDINTVIELLKLIELKKLNRQLIRMNETMKYLR